MTYYLLKTTGKGVVPDYFQVRDGDYVIIAYFKVDNINKGVQELGIKDEKKQAIFIEALRKLEYGKLVTIQI